jgi:sugar/nucleoside kinase (ribokinase family)
MEKRSFRQAVVAGHICLDVIPSLENRAGGLNALLEPGKLVNVGPAVTSTGGAVSNTGLALHRLGVPTTLMGKVGDDLFGAAIMAALRRHAGALADGMIVSPDVSSSYTIVINPPGVDRIFLHCPGANDTFRADDVKEETLAEASLLHFGYPPLMRSMYLDDGRELASLFQRAKANGVTTSLDMSRPDPDSEAGRLDWKRYLDRVLTHVDLFLPSLEEILFMLDRQRYDQLTESCGEGELAALIDGDTLAGLADDLLQRGVAVVAIKLGAQGLYVRTSKDPERMGRMGAAAPVPEKAWIGREMLSPCFSVQVAGTTGAGDCTIAGFLAGLLHGLALDAALTAAVAVGACNVEKADATSGVPDWETVHRRIRNGWRRRQTLVSLPGWRWDETRQLWIGPHDQEF